MIRVGPRGVLAALTSLCLLTGCASYYSVEVSGDRPDQLYSVFLIVAKEDPLDTGDGSPSSLIRPERIGEYLFFAQYEPGEGTPLNWRRESQDSKSPMITLEPAGDHRVLTLEIDKSLLDEYPQLTVVAVGHGIDRWYAKPIDAGKIRLESGLRLDAGSAEFFLRPMK